MRPAETRTACRLAAMKIHRQDRPEVSTPPIRGPMATARAVTAPHTPNAMQRFLPRKTLASNASDTANMIAPPTPLQAAGQLEH